MTNQQIPFSVLDLMPTRKDRSHTQTMRYTLEAAQAVERFGFSRYWVPSTITRGRCFLRRRSW